MPAKNSRKTYVKNAYYHLYNRGVNKQPIFQDQKDYNVFQNYLKEYLTDKNDIELTAKLQNKNLSWQEKDTARRLLALNNFSDQITLLCYCLMPNHLHFLIKQNTDDSMDNFMNSLCTRYTMYFNKKHHRVGHLYQGVYKAVMVESTNQLLYLSKYIHRQAGTTSPRRPSSLDYYLKVDDTNNIFVNTSEILSFFRRSDTNTYYNFVFDNEPIVNQVLSPLCFLD